MNHSFDIAELINKYIREELSDAEKETLNNWRSAKDENEAKFIELISSEHQLKKLRVYELFDEKAAWNAIEISVTKKGKVLPLLVRKSFRYAAILVPLAVLVTTYFILNNQETTSDIANVDEVIKPGAQRATLTLSDGESVELNQLQSNIEEKGTTIENRENKLKYIAKRKTNRRKELVFNKLETPRGGTYNLTLADGTEVWLNAGSELRFPVEFSDTVRQVYLTGEAYFDVTHNGKPFIVSLEKANIRVLGTSFNVSSYSDETNLTATLVEGMIAFNTLSDNVVNSQILTPGLQAIYSESTEKIEVHEVNTSSFISWKDGKVEFNNENLELVMKKLARWYDFEYRFENTEAKDYHFTARFSRGDNISGILNMLELTTEVKFELENNTIVIQ